MRIAAVTGTNGKSSTISYTQQMLENDNRPVWTITNTGIREPDGDAYSLFWLREKGCIKKLLDVLPIEDEDIVLIEAYSLSIMANEWDGLELDAVAFTSFGRDHLDIHGSITSYFDVKLKLFEYALKHEGTAVINTQIPYIDRFKQLSNQRGFHLVTYGSNGIGHGLYPAFLEENYIGAQHLFKALTKTSSACFYDSLKPLSGRIQEIKNDLEIKVYIDYAHNANALDFVLRKLSAAPGKLITVFGCGGERDSGKRYEMGLVAGSLSDEVIVTDDNPRTENPALIRKQIMEGCPTAMEIYPREQAIYHAVSIAEKGDCILVCGMGNDSWFNQTIGKVVNDEEVLIDILSGN